MLILVLLIVIAECGAMSCIRMSGVEAAGMGHYLYFIFGTLLYVLVALLLKKSFDIRGMAVVNTLWSALSVITVAGIGCFYFGEKLTHWEIIAVGLATVAATIMAQDK